MIDQNEIREKVKGFWRRIRPKFDKNNSEVITSRADNPEDSSMYEFTPDDKVATSPRTKAPLTDQSLDAQNVVWDNEDASMQDKSYSFDEESTGTNYDIDDDDIANEQENRYK